MGLNQNIKKSITKILLCIYIFALFKPVSPLIFDILAHTFFEEEHMATVHFSHGKHHYHLYDELAKEAEDDRHDSKGTGGSSLSSSKTLEAHLTTNAMGLTSYLKLIKTEILPKNKELPHVFIQKVIPPPKA